jgi:putative nucleotidyltransferase with HDIG domain
VLNATERLEATEFTSRDRKLLEGLSAIAASALLSCRLHAQVNRQMMSAIQALASAVDAKDHYTHDHSGRVAQLCLATARELGIRDSAECRELELAGLLHDIGKIGVPDAILSKADRLTPQEYAVVKTHVEIGARIADHVQGLERVAKAILCHHERYDGMGYPAGLPGDAIPLASKLIAVCDAFDSLTSDRSYRKGIRAEEGLREIRRCSGTQFDPDIVDAFGAVIERELGPTPHPRARMAVAH